MLNAKEYLPIGSIVLLKNGVKKVMIIGIMQAQLTGDGDATEDFDYIGVLFPEGFLTTDTMILFNHENIYDIVFKGYENRERSEFVEKLQENMDKIREIVTREAAEKSE